MSSATDLAYRKVPVDSMRCSGCITGEDSCDHILLSCPYADWIWDHIFNWCGLGLRKFASISDLLNSILSDKLGPVKKQKVIYSVVMGTLWAIWRARNNRIFNSTVLV